MIIVHGPHLKMQHKVNFLSKCISLFFQTPPWSPFFTSLKHWVVVYFGHGTISKRFIPKDKSTQKKITKQKIESKYFMCDAAPFFFLSRITQESNSAWGFESIQSTTQINLLRRPLPALHTTQSQHWTDSSVQLGTHKGKMSEMQITLENFSSFQCYLKSTMIDWNFSLELISTQIGPSI